jgi:YebC/PmpR family DNA-binding regulatory protein
MSGHSKWATIKRKKSALDAKRGKAFTKLIKEITVAAKSGSDLGGNPRLRLLVEKAKEINMPHDNITRAIKRGSGELPGVSYEEYTYEGYGPFGVAVMVDVLTDNKNRTVPEIRRLFSHTGGSMGETGSVNWMFEKSGVISIPKAGHTEDDVLEKLLDYDIKDISSDDEMITITCEPKATEAIKKALKDTGYTIAEGNIEWVAKTTAALDDEKAEKVYEFLSELEDHDDVQNVYSNLA